MKRVIILVIMAVALMYVDASAQRISYVKSSICSVGAGGASISITEDEGVKQAVSLIESRTSTPSKVKGYRFVIFHDSEQFANERASRALNTFRRMFKSVSSYLSVESPTFRILVGDCYNHDDVAVVRNKIECEYPDAALAEADIPLRFLLRYQGQNNMLIERSGQVSGGIEFEELFFDEEQGAEGDDATEVIETPQDLAEATPQQPKTEVIEQAAQSEESSDVAVAESEPNK
jgi:hypothetical protein